MVSLDGNRISNALNAMKTASLLVFGSAMGSCVVATACEVATGRNMSAVVLLSAATMSASAAGFLSSKGVPKRPLNSSEDPLVGRNGPSV